MTVVACAVAVVAAVVQYAAPAVVPVLERDPDHLAEGEWWRLVTPLFVQTLGWHQVAANLVTLAVIGVVAEAVLRRPWWLAYLASGAVGGQVAAYAWGEPGGGSSIAICGLTGCLLVTLAVRAAREPVPPLLVVPVVGYVALLAGWWFGLLPLAALSCLGFAVCYLALRLIRVVNAEVVALLGAIAVAALLAVLRDLHGASLTSGIAVAALALVLRVVTVGRRTGGHPGPAGAAGVSLRRPRRRG